jgi:hypothetical protein
VVGLLSLPAVAEPQGTVPPEAYAPPVIASSILAATALASLEGAPGSPPSDARTYVNAWRVRYNAGVGKLQSGDAAGAALDARASLALVSADHRQEPLLLLAAAASQAGDVPLSLEALQGLGTDAAAPWQLYYNGSIDASQAGRDDLAHRFAQAALARTPDMEQVGPVALRAALRVRDLDAALRAGALLPAGHPAREELGTALVAAGRCSEARGVVAGACP